MATDYPINKKVRSREAVDNNNVSFILFLFITFERPSKNVVLVICVCMGNGVFKHP